MPKKTEKGPKKSLQKSFLDSNIIFSLKALFNIGLILCLKFKIVGIFIAQLNILIAFYISLSHPGRLFPSKVNLFKPYQMGRPESFRRTVIELSYIEVLRGAMP